jgi:hypothetical protein
MKKLDLGDERVDDITDRRTLRAAASSCSSMGVATVEMEGLRDIAGGGKRALCFSLENG